MTTEAITPLRQRMIEDMDARKLCAGDQHRDLALGHVPAGDVPMELGDGRLNGGI